MIGALEADGDNTTKLKHMGKAKLIREGNLPVSLPVEEDVVENARGNLWNIIVMLWRRLQGLLVV